MVTQKQTNLENGQASSHRRLLGDGSTSLIGSGKIVEEGRGRRPDSENSDSSDPHAHKLGWMVTALFIVADMVGGGVVAMPVAFKQSGMLPGIVFMVVTAVVFLYTGIQLGQVWNVMQERWTEYHDHCRKPFPEIAKRSMGPGAKKFTSIVVNVTLFGIAVVYLLLSAQIVAFFYGELQQSFPTLPQLSQCYLICILAFVLAPFTFLKSPADFWPVIVIAMVTTSLSVVAILWGEVEDMPTCSPIKAQNEWGLKPALASVGTFLFAFSGHYVFPTIQHDMKQPKRFTLSVSVGFVMVVVLYMPLSVLAYHVYGDAMRGNVILSINSVNLQSFANAMIAIHCILTLVIVINPVNQELEDHFRIAHHLGRGRIALRSAVLIAVVFVGLSVPNFNPVINIVGSSTMPIGCVVLPSLFYLYINAAEEYEWRKNKIPSFREVIRRTPKGVLVLNAFIIAFSLLIGVAAVVSAVEEAGKGDGLAVPCYMRWLNENATEAAGDHFGYVCCGVHRDTTSRLNETCDASIEH